MSKFSIFSFFSGSGFLDLGFEKAGFEVVYANDFFKPFLDAYAYSRKKIGMREPKYGQFCGSIIECILGSEASKLAAHIKQEKDAGRLIGFIGGPPCPDFSVGGKNRGHEGENGRLSQSYKELIIAKEPDFFVFENVKGLWRTQRHRSFYEHLKHSLRENGYLLTEKLINALEYGAPQDRERIILFGIKEEQLESNTTEAQLERFFNWGGATKYSSEIVRTFTTKVIGEKAAPIIPEDLTVQYWFTKNDVQNHPNARHCFIPRAGLAKFKTIAEGDDSRKSYKRLHRLRYSPTAAYGNNEVHIHPTEARRISAAEALAIQSLPKEFELPQGMTLTNMFKTIGNGVPFLAALGIAHTILNFTERRCYANKFK